MAQSRVAQTRALVLFSGGQDSTVCLGWALERYDAVETLGFDYGQRHRIELTQRTRVLERLAAVLPKTAGRLGADHVLALPTLGVISETSLTRDVAFAIDASGLPNTFVPGRNLLFFTYAAALAWRRGITTLIGGMCETDFSGYPDCRNDTLQALNRSLSLGMDRAYEVVTPLMWRTKAETWEMAEALGGPALVDLIVTETVTCYLGDRGQMHAWGTGCGACPSCELRAKGWKEWQAGKS